MEDLFPNYRLREMYESDLEWVLKARNHAFVRGMSGSDKKITMLEHRVWFDCSTDCLKLVYTLNNEPKGVVLYDKDGFWSFYLRPVSGGYFRRGHGRIMASLFLAFAYKYGLKVINAKVVHYNGPSIHLHEGLGFKVQGMDKDGMITYRKEL